MHMRRFRFGIKAVATGLGLAALSLPVRGEDWPCYQKDARRSAVTRETLAFPLSARWLRPAARPAPAWPEPGRAVNMFDFDYTYPPVAADGRVFYASSADDTLYAMDARSGAVAWTFTADAPLRFAPHVYEGKCYVAGDDGTVYCLDAATGTLVWQYRHVPANRMISGNGRMMSRWPCRSGVLVQDGTVYATSGMWPAEGTYFYALDAATGKLKWANDTANAKYMPFPHEGLSFGGPTPQGYLLADAGVLVVPCGHSGPAGFDLNTGRLLYWHQSDQGSTWASLAGGVIRIAARGWQGDQEIRLGEAPLWVSDGIAFRSLRNGRAEYDPKWDGYNKIPGAALETLGRLRGCVLPVSGRDRIVSSDDRHFVSGMDAIEALDASQKKLAQVWRVTGPRAYCLALCGNALLVGREGTVAALDPRDGRTLWTGAIQGRARGLAIADGRLYVSTDLGPLYAFGPGAAADAAPTVPPAAAAAPSASEGLPSTLRSAAAQQGFALVVGNRDATLTSRLACNPALNVIGLLKDPGALSAARRALLARNYGRGITLHATPADGSLPYADYFANLIAVDGDTGGIDPRELYRALHPCTGRMIFTGMPADAALKLAAQCGAQTGEIRNEGGTVSIERGPLPGAFDWNSPTKVDERIRWPLELLWFGGPGRDRMTARHARGAPPPLPANGRVIVEGNVHVIAVDAYNGTELWQWLAPGYRSLYADASSVYINLRSVVQCDAQSGRITKVYGNPRPFVFSLDQPRTFSSRRGNKYSGSIEVAKTATGIEVTLDTRTPTPHDSDSWLLRFDFREPAERLLPAGRGAFPVIVNTRNGTFRPYTDSPLTVVPDLQLVRKTGAEGDKLVLTVPFAAIRALTGAMPSSFDLAAQVNLFEFGREAPRRWLDARPITDGEDLLGNGTATFVLSGAALPSASPLAAVTRADRASLPDACGDWGALPYLQRHDGNIPRPPVASELNPSLKSRTSYITGKTADLRYLRGYGCSGTIASSSMDFFRSGTLGMYDLADDSGMRNFPGMKPGCQVSLLPALGMLISMEANADCFCPYSFATSLALAPAARRKNEDWALYYDKMDVAPVRRMALNFGAPGDRRDEKGVLWLGYPRQPAMFVSGGALGPEAHTFGLPLAVETIEGSRFARVNADRTPLPGDSPAWVAASAWVGLRKLTVGLTYYEPRTTCLTLPATPAPAVDADLSDSCWGLDMGTPIATAPDQLVEQAAVRVRHDATNLYFAYEQLPAANADKPRKTAVARDGENIWSGDHFDVVLKNDQYPLCINLGMSAGGARYGADISYNLRVPPLRAITIDGKAGDWQGQGVELVFFEGRGSCRLGWTEKGLAMLTTVPTNFFLSQHAWNALRTEVVNRDSRAVLETLVDAATQTVSALEAVFAPQTHPAKERDWPAFRKSRKMETGIASVREPDRVTVETLFPFDKLGLAGPGKGRLGLYLVAYNPAATDENILSGAAVRRAVFSDAPLLALELSESGAPATPVRSGGIRGEWYGAGMLFALPAAPIAPSAWSGAVADDDRSFRAEFAVPLALLNAAGIPKDKIRVLFRTPARMKPDIDELSRAFVGKALRLYTGNVDVRPADYTVRLHLAELEETPAAHRTFDVRLQGKTVDGGLDIAKSAGGRNRSVVRTYKGIRAENLLTLEFVPSGPKPDLSALPLINGLEILAE